jgi:DNA-binding FrmR family transcriptional regulator
MAHTKSNKDALLARVRRISGQMAAIEKAISDDAACNTILHQVAGVRGAVGGLMDDLAQPGLSDAERAEAADDIIAAIRRYAK